MLIIVMGYRGTTNRSYFIHGSNRKKGLQVCKKP